MVGGVKDARTQYVDLNGSTSLDITDPFGLDGVTEPSYTIYTEVTIDSAAGSQYWTLTSGNPGLRIDNTGGTLRWYHIWGGNFSGGRYDTLLTVGETCKLTFVYDGTQVASGFSLYKDGSLVTKSASYDTQLGALGADAVIPWGFDGTTNYNNDKIHCLWFFNDNLTGSDLTTINSLPNKATLDDYTGSKTNLTAAYDFENSADLGKDSHSTNDLTVNGSPTVGAERETSMDLLEVGIDNSNAVDGRVIGQVINHENVFQLMDTSSNSNHLEKSTYTDQPIFNDTNTSVSFDGTDDIMEFASGAENLFDGGGQFAIVLRAGDNIAVSDRILEAYTGNGWVFLVEGISGSTVRFYFIKQSSTTAGQWRHDEYINLNQDYLIQILYDPSDVSNNPLIYINNVSKTVTELQTPVGTLDQTESGSFKVGGRSTGNHADFELKRLVLQPDNKETSRVIIANELNEELSIY